MVYLEGNWYGFISTHMTLKDGKIFEAGTDLLVAEVVSNSFVQTDAVVLPISEALRMVKFLSYAPISKPGRPIAKWRDPVDCLSDPYVLVKNDAMATTSAKVISVDGSFRINSSDGPKTYMGAFGIKANHNEVIIGKDGDGGSSIMTVRGELLGVLIGAVDEDFYCAPAKALFDRYFPGFDHLNVVS
jgi:hypothetical protein